MRITRCTPRYAQLHLTKFSNIPKGRRHGQSGDKLREAYYTFGGEEFEGYDFERIFIEGGVDAYFAGHEHVMQHLHANGIHHFVCGASGATRTGFYGGEDCKREMDWFSPTATGFVAVSVTSNQMLIEFVSNDPQQTILHSVTIDKSMAEKS